MNYIAKPSRGLVAVFILSVAALHCFAQPCIPSPSGLVGWWPAEGNANDAVGGNHGALFNGATFGAGQVGQSFSFDGVSNYVKVPASASLNVGLGAGLTIEAWINPSVVPGGHPIVEWSRTPGGPPYGVHLWLSHPSHPPGLFFANIIDTQGGEHLIITPPGLINSNAFYHVAVTYDNASGLARLFLNGTNVVEQNLGVFTPQTSYDLFFGRRPPGDINSRLFAGLIDEISIYNRALSPTEIQAIFTADGAGKCPPPPSCTPPPSGLVAWWPAEGNANDAVDGNHGALFSGTAFGAGEVGRAFSFDGVSNYVKVPASASLNVGLGSGLTIEAWINPTVVPGGHPIVEWSRTPGGSPYGVHLWLSHPSHPPGLFFANITDTQGGQHPIFSPPGLIAANVFYHVAVTYDKASGQARLFLNGTNVVEQNLGVFTPQTSYDLFFGRRPPGDINSRLYAGLIDEISIYNRALSVAELQSIYSGGSAGKCKPLAPTITSQPQGQIVTAGNDVSFAVAATGTAPLRYQWRFNGRSIFGETNSTLTLLNVQPAQAGDYSVFVANSVSSVISSVATLTVNLAVCVAPPSGLVGWWPADGDARDSVGTNHGTLVGATFASGKVGQAFSLDGSGSHVRIPASDSLNVGLGAGLTVEAWINPTVVPGGHPIVEWSRDPGGSPYGVHLWLSHPSHPPGLFFANIADIQGGQHPIFSPPGLITSNTFYHVAVTYDKASGLARLLLNGTNVVEQNLGSFTPQTSYDLYFGRRSPGDINSLTFAGLIDEVEIYNHALSPPEIQMLYDASFAGKCPLPPVILVPPRSQSAFVGADVTFAVAASGSPPLNYQWSFKGSPIAGATNDTLLLTHVSQESVGEYYVQVINGAGSATSSSAMLVLLNRSPVAVSQSVGLDEDTSAIVALVASDPDGDLLTYSLTLPVHGSLSGTAPDLVYTPAPNYFGLDAFTFRVSDGQLESTEVSVNIEVRPVNDPPVAKATIGPLLKLTPEETNVVVLSLNNSNAAVVFDGSLSFDIENDALEYVWFVDDEPIGVGVTITNELELGTHTITLLVDDGRVFSSDTISVAVISGGEAVEEIVLMVEDGTLTRKNKQPLIATLKASIAAFNRENHQSAINQLRAFQNKVRAQVAPSNGTLADSLNRAAQEIINALDGT